MSKSKRMTAVSAGIERTKLYPLTDAVKLVKEKATAKFVAFASCQTARVVRSALACLPVVQRLMKPKQQAQT